MPKGKGFNVKESRERYREVIVECAKFAKQFPRGQRLRAYRGCLKRRLRVIYQPEM